MNFILVLTTHYVFLAFSKRIYRGGGSWGDLVATYQLIQRIKSNDIITKETDKFNVDKLWSSTI